MARYDYDLLTIGAGSGGVRASRMAAQFGARVAICEEGRVGGTCVIRGCVPKKLLVYGAHYADDFKDATGYGWSATAPPFDWDTLITNKNREIDRLNKVYIRILGENGVKILAARARLTDPHTVEIGDRSVTAANILVATGSWPVMPDIPGIEHAITSNEALELSSLPQRMVIVGGGYIAVEFAGIFNSLGVDVAEVMRADTILRGFDEDMRVTLADEMIKRGVDLRCHSVVHSIEKTESGAFNLLLAHGELIETDLIMCATGRAPNIKGLGLEEAGVEINDKGAVGVDGSSRTSVPHIFAVGDVTGRFNLTPVAITEGAEVARTLFSNNPSVVDYSNIPTAVFSQPPLACVGLTETEARAGNAHVDVYLSHFKPMKFTLSERDENSVVKLVVDGNSDRVLGCHIVGMDAPEIIQGFAVALKAGATKAQFDATIGIHPSGAEEFVTMREKRPPHTARKAADYPFPGRPTGGSQSVFTKENPDEDHPP
jgi:glutathione reductase (NADPH)